jgi:hypothetical protein
VCVLQCGVPLRQGRGVCQVCNTCVFLGSFHHRHTGPASLPALSFSMCVPCRAARLSCGGQRAQAARWLLICCGLTGVAIKQHVHCVWCRQLSNTQQSDCVLLQPRCCRHHHAATTPRDKHQHLSIVPIRAGRA